MIDGQHSDSDTDCNLPISTGLGSAAYSNSGDDMTVGNAVARVAVDVDGEESGDDDGDFLSNSARSAANNADSDAGMSDSNADFVVDNDIVVDDAGVLLSHSHASPPASTGTRPGTSTDVGVDADTDADADLADSDGPDADTDGNDDMLMLSDTDDVSNFVLPPPDHNGITGTSAISASSAGDMSVARNRGSESDGNATSVSSDEDDSGVLLSSIINNSNNSSNSNNNAPTTNNTTNNNNNTRARASAQANARAGAGTGGGGANANAKAKANTGKANATARAGAGVGNAAKSNSTNASKAKDVKNTSSAPADAGAINADVNPIPSYPQSSNMRSNYKNSSSGSFVRSSPSSQSLPPSLAALAQATTPSLLTLFSFAYNHDSGAAPMGSYNPALTLSQVRGLLS